MVGHALLIERGLESIDALSPVVPAGLSNARTFADPLMGVSGSNRPIAGASASVGSIMPNSINTGSALSKPSTILI